MVNDIENYDDRRRVSWYCKLANPPDIATTTYVAEFAALVSACLRIPVPTIQWFAKTEASEASRIWEEFSFDNKQPFLIENPDWVEDPMRFDCPVFFLAVRDEEVPGFTPVASDGYVGIQAGLSYRCTLHAVADECFHIYQDVSRGREWRRDTDTKVVEDEAAHFASSLSEFIRRFLEARGVID